MAYDDTIAALATPPGRGAVSIVRVSGAEALAIGMELAGLRPRPRHAHVCTFRDEAGLPVDRGMVLFFPAPGRPPVTMSSNCTVTAAWWSATGS